MMPLTRTLLMLLLIALGPLTAPPSAPAEITFKLPPPELGALLPLAAMPLDKPQVALPGVAAPAPPVTFAELPPPRLVGDPAHRPIAPPPSPRILACNPVGTVLRVASELVECGRARYQRGDFEEARQAFQSAVQGSSDRYVLREARYWLGETLLKLGRTSEVERVFLLVAQDDPRSEFGIYARHQLGWAALERNEPARALVYFEDLLRGSLPPALVSHARHGRAMSLYGLKRYQEARDEWQRLLTQSPPRTVATEANFWLGDTLGRLGDHKGAISRLQAFTSAGPHLLIETALLRLGWWSRAAGQPLEAAKAYRGLISAYPKSSELVWARLGLVQALLDLDDYPAAREEARRLDPIDRSGKLVIPTLLLMRQWLAEKDRAEEARALDDQLLGQTLEPASRAYVLLLSGDLARRSGQAGEARDRLELVRTSTPGSELAHQAAFRLARMDFDAREFAQAETVTERLLRERLSPELRAAALVLAGEAAYWARHYEQAARYYTTFLTEFPTSASAPPVSLALGWAEFRRGRRDAARERWTRFAQEASNDPRAPQALLLAAELAEQAGDRQGALALFDQVASRYPGTEHADVATLNRAILLIGAGRAGTVLPELSRLVERAPLSSYGPRMRVARGIALLTERQSTDAERDFRAAVGQGEDALARLGLGVVALERGQWEEASRQFAEARDAGPGGTVVTAEYGLAAAAFNQRKLEEFNRFATALLDRPSAPGASAAGSVTPQMTVHLLHGMEAAAAEGKRWSDARTFALRLVREFSTHPAAPAALAEVGSAAARDQQWPLAREMYQLLLARYPDSPGLRAGRVDLGEALLRTGAAVDARRELEAFVGSSPGDPRLPRATLLLAEAQEATGNRSAAADLYTRYATTQPAGKETPGALMAAGRLLQGDAQWERARPLLERAIASTDGEVAAEAAFRMGEGFRAAGQQEDAVEAYMTAAYLVPSSPWARRALVGAAQSFTALKQNDSAVIVYRKLLASTGLEPELATAARRALQALGAN